jgi:hypothetical protein
MAAAPCAVAAEGEPALALAHLDDDHHVVVARAGYLAFEVSHLAVADHRLAGGERGLDPGLQLGLSREPTVARPVDRPQGAVGVGGDGAG